MTETNLHEYIVLTKDEFLEPISSGYAKMIENAPDEDLIDNYNPGPTKADGSVNFECHCVSHMVASPCGFEFREAISCQRNASEEDLKAGACVDQFIRFMDCTMETGCFKKKADNEEKSAEEQSKEKYHLFMEAEPTIHQLKRSADEPSSNRDGPPQKRRNTGSILDLRRTRSRANAYVNSTGGTLTDPLNLNNAAPESSAQSFVERKRRFDDAPAGVYQRRVSFRLPKKRPDQLVTPTTEEPDSKVEARKNKQASMNLRYRYGNFNYFQKTSAHFQNDPRLDLMVEDWFLNKAVLDIGCNSGYLTLSIARTFGPRRILGIDIDSHLIDAARKNIRHFQDKDLKIATKFPASFALNYGPTSAPTTSTSSEFPNNVWFRTENYVLESDEELENVKEEYDSILAFSITKWIHLNWGDAGLQRFFKRVYRQLKPGGRFVFEPQSSRGYRKRAKMTEEINKTYKTIKFWPESYVSFLMSIGFCHYEALDTPLVQLLDCDAPILMFYKGPLAGWKNSPAPNQQQVYEASEFGDQPQIISFTTPRAESQYSSTPRDDPNSPSTPDFSRND